MHELLHNFSIWSVIVPAITGLILFRRYLNKESKIMCVITLVACIPQIGVSYMKLSKSYNFILYNIYTLIEVGLYAVLFYLPITTVKNRRVHLLLLCAYVVFLFLFYPLQLSSRFYSEWVAFANLLYMLWVLLFLYEKYTSHQYMLSVKSSFFWYCIGLLVYAPTTFLMFALYQKVSINNKATYSYLWQIHDIFNSIMYLLFAVGMITCYRFRKQNSNLYED